MPLLRFIAAAILLCAASVATAQPASTGSGQTYPNKAVRMVVPYAPGGRGGHHGAHPRAQTRRCDGPAIRDRQSRRRGRHHRHRSGRQGYARRLYAVVHDKAGRLRALGASSAKRLAVLPDVPSIAESGYPGFDHTDWYGVVAPANTPAAVVTRLNTEINAALAAPEVRERVAAMGAESAGSTAQEFSARIKIEIEKWARVFRKPAL